MQDNRPAQPSRNSDDLEQSSPRSDQGKMRRTEDIPKPCQNGTLRRDARGEKRRHAAKAAGLRRSPPARPAGGEERVERLRGEKTEINILKSADNDRPLNVFPASLEDFENWSSWYTEKKCSGLAALINRAHTAISTHMRGIDNANRSLGCFGTMLRFKCR